MDRSVRLLVHFGDLLSRAAEPAEVMELLAEVGLAEIGADAAVVVAINEQGELELGASRQLDQELGDWLADVDAIGTDLEHRILAACHRRFACVHTIPLASDKDLYGALLLLQVKLDTLDERRLGLATGLAGLAASGLSRAAKYAELLRSYSELQASREVLARSQKLRALGEMAAGVSHDLKNILNPLSLNLQFLRRLVPRDQKQAHESIDDMLSVLERGVQTIERLRTFSRLEPSGNVKVVDLSSLAHEAMEIVRPRTRMNSRIAFRLHEDLLVSVRAKVDPAEAVAAFVNLLVNAIDALEHGGNVRLATGVDDQTAWVRVSDDGPGMSKEIEARVFEPFFTTKGEQGTGLGLAMVYGFVQHHGGTILLETAPGKGATFTLRLPRA